MKYMGSKRAMLDGQLGVILLSSVAHADRFVDLFTGSAAVATFVAENSRRPVIASDLQSFAIALASAVIERDTPVNGASIWTSWKERAQSIVDNVPLYSGSEAIDGEEWGKRRRHVVDVARLVAEASDDWPIVRAYGGHYFSPKQAYEIEALRRTLPTRADERGVALAALIAATSECAAAPGHTAQPFAATQSGARFLFEAWRRDVFQRTELAMLRFAARHALVSGEAIVADATIMAERTNAGDLVFVDPPYSAVQYSRFYHVLETVARNAVTGSEGVGRYPPSIERPRSEFVSRARAIVAMDALLSALAHRGSRVILTFPRGEASNGLSGDRVEEIAARYFEAEKTVCNGRFSTLGGGPSSRGARAPAYELILQLTPIRLRRSVSKPHHASADPVLQVGGGSPLGQCRIAKGP